MPPGWYIAAVFADVESGAIDIENRSKTGSWHVLTGAGLQRDGGMADMLAEAASPEPRFAVVACEDIERSARDTYNSLRIERELSSNGIILCATDEPASIEGANATMILVRRVKQGVAEWYRLQLKEKIWKGLQEHHLAGWNTGPVPYGYAASRHPHPNPMKAGMGLTRHKLTEDPETAPWVSKIFEWRTLDHMALTAIARRLEELGAPGPGSRKWTATTVDAILRNPKYTGHMVWGRSTRNSPGRGTTRTRVPQDQWLWTPAPAHPALTAMATWKEAQQAARTRGTVRDRETPARRNSGAPMRGRIRCGQCHRVLSPSTQKYKDHVNLYYVCAPNLKDPRTAARYKDHVRASLKDTLITKVIAAVLDTRVLGPDRAAMLTAQLPATQAEKTAERDNQAAALRRQLRKIETSQDALMTELEELGGDTSPAAAAGYRRRIRARYNDRAAQRTETARKLGNLETETLTADDPALLDAIPRAAGKFTTAPPDPRSPLQRPRHPGALPPRQKPDHHLGNHHRRHPPNHPRTPRRPPHRHRHRPPSPSPPQPRRTQPPQFPQPCTRPSCVPKCAVGTLGVGAHSRNLSRRGSHERSRASGCGPSARRHSGRSHSGRNGQVSRSVPPGARTLHSL
jgi:DNA invertase Pin-like site-specific DNA recombinase